VKVRFRRHHQPRVKAATGNEYPNCAVPATAEEEDVARNYKTNPIDLHH